MTTQALLDDHSQIALNLRQGIIDIKNQYRRRLADNPLCEQWQWLSMKEVYDIDWAQHQKKQDHFAWKSNNLLRELKGA